MLFVVCCRHSCWTGIFKNMGLDLSSSTIWLQYSTCQLHISNFLNVSICLYLLVVCLFGGGQKSKQPTKDINLPTELQQIVACFTHQSLPKYTKSVCLIQQISYFNLIIKNYVIWSSKMSRNSLILILRYNR